MTYLFYINNTSFIMTMEERKNTCRKSNHQNVCLLLADGSESHYPRSRRCLHSL